MNNYLGDLTNNESYDSWNETDDENEDDDILYEYEPEEIGPNKFNLVLCEKYNKHIHGEAPISMNNYYITYVRFKYFNANITESFSRDSNDLNLEIAECIYLPSGHCVSIIKTFWLKIIQKKWKHIFKERKRCIVKRCNPNALKHIEIYGKWPTHCKRFPQLKGMLSSLSRTTSRSMTN